MPIEYEVNILKQIVLPEATPGLFTSNKYSNMTLFRYENN
jgi:ABC-type nitrate/sulfonate/bicarbonate transport system permease component